MAVIYRSLWGIYIVLYHLTLFGSLAVPAKKKNTPKKPSSSTTFLINNLESSGCQQVLSPLSSNNLWLKGTRA